jgi:hypothetical protein
MTKRGENIKAIISIIQANPGITRAEAHKAFLIHKGYQPGKANRGRFVSYFYTDRQSQWSIVDGCLYLT